MLCMQKMQLLPGSLCTSRISSCCAIFFSTSVERTKLIIQLYTSILSPIAGKVNSAITFLSNIVNKEFYSLLNVVL